MNAKTTKVTVEAAENEVSENYEYFKKMQAEWLDGHLSDHALIHHQKLVDFFESENDAIHTGVREFGWGNFSVQSVKNDPIDLGHQSNILF